MTPVTAEGFAPVFQRESRLLILGSFPSVLSRASQFYYGNPQNRFWRTVCGFFGEEPPRSVEEKRDFLFRRKIALWDVVTRCEIVGSADLSIRNEEIADLPAVIEGSEIAAVFCNGSKAFSLLERHFPRYLPIARKLSSTSPANPRFRAEEWFGALETVFPGQRREGG